MLKWSNPRDYAERSITYAWIYDQSSFINIFTQKRSISIGDQTISHIGWLKTNTEIGTFKIIGSLFVLQTDEAQDFKIVTKAVKNVRHGSYYMSN